MKLLILLGCVAVVFVMKCIQGEASGQWIIRSELFEFLFAAVLWVVMGYAFVESYRENQ